MNMSKSEKEVLLEHWGIVSKARMELYTRLGEKLKVQFQKAQAGAVIFAGPTSLKFMEDNILITTVTNMIGMDDCEAVNEAIEHAQKNENKKVAICVDIWGKLIIKMTSELYKFVREVVDDIAKKYDMLKVYAWGCDDGGMVVFDANGKTVVRSYYSRGLLEVDMYGPESEEEYWEHWLSKEYDDNVQDMIKRMDKKVTS